MSRRREQPQYLRHVRCPECGVPMAERARTSFGKDAEATGARFYGCARFPLCVGTRPIGIGVDSYTKLLREAYSKALVFLSSPKFLGPAEATRWLLTQALADERDAAEAADVPFILFPNEALERGIDSACEYAAYHDIDQDFLVLAHEERLLAVRSRLKYGTKPEVMRRMPKAEIQRRYDTSVIEQFEATITTDWISDGQHCPRCGQWATALPIEVDAAPKEIDWDALFNARLEQELNGTWTCVACGVFSRIGDSYIYKNDALDPACVKGVTFRPSRRR